jgi:hypothetical protein
MTPFRFPRLRLRLTFGLAALAAGCASPSWQYDHYVVEGALMGETCRATIDGRPFVGDTTGLGEKLSIQHDNVSDVGLPEGQGVKTIVCRGLVLQLVSPEGAFPSRQRFRVADGVSLDTGVVSVHVEHSDVGEGHWPFALTGVHLEGKEGFLQLDEMTKYLARGTFRAIVRRQPNGG